MLTSSLLSAQTFFVKSGAIGDGSSWTNASGDLNNIIENAPEGSEVWVAEGTYTPVVCSACTEANRNTSFEIPNGVAIYGGFLGSEISLEERDWSNNTTILSGDIDADGTLAGNSYTIIYTNNVDNTTILDGFKIAYGNANSTLGFPATRHQSGGGWFNDGSQLGSVSSPTIRNCHFFNNQAVGSGAGFYNDGGFQGSNENVFEHCIFEDNFATQGGGAVFNFAGFEGHSSPQFSNCTFNNNSTNMEGGGIHNNGGQGGISNPTFNNCHFIENHAVADGGGLMNKGHGGESSPQFTDCTFVNNSSDNNGAAVYNYANFQGVSYAGFYNCFFTGNFSGENGAGMYNSGYQGDCIVSLENCDFIANHSGGAGAGVFNNGGEGNSSPIVKNCEFSNNIADTYGAGMYNQGKTGNSSPIITNCKFYKNIGSSAGGMYNLGSEGGNANPIITNCTFYGNEANVGGAIYSNAGDTTGTASPTIVNCILWANVANFGAVFRNIGGRPIISYSLVDAADCEVMESGINSLIDCGAGMMFNENPLFIDESNGDLHVMDGSPVIDMGLNAAIMNLDIDLDSLVRINNGVVDLGAYEYNNGTIYEAPQIVVQPNSGDICEGENFNFLIEVSGTGPFEYQWIKDGINIPSNNTNEVVLINVNNSNAGIYECIITGPQGEVVPSQVVELLVTPLAELSINLVAESINICVEEDLVVLAEVENAGLEPVFEWFVNGNSVSGSNEELTFSNLSNGDEITCEITSIVNCLISNSILSTPIVIEVNEWVDPTIIVDSDVIEICEDETVSFVASIENGGNDPIVQWMVNGENVGTNNLEFSSSNLTNNDEISCELISSMACVNNISTISDGLTIIVNPILQPMINITANTNEICAGEMIQFNANTENEGETPSFQWMINGEIVMENSNTYNTNSLSDNDIISCELISLDNCLSNSSSISNEITIFVSENIDLNININTSSPPEICIGEPLTFVAISNNQGISLDYNWMINGLSVNENGNSFIAEDLMNDDIVSCQLSSSALCLNEPFVISNEIPVIVDSCNMVSTEYLEQIDHFSLFPNPVKDQIFVKFDQPLEKNVDFKIISVDGKVLFTKMILAQRQLNEQIFLPSLISGIYFVGIQSNAFFNVKKIAIQ